MNTCWMCEQEKEIWDCGLCADCYHFAHEIEMKINELDLASADEQTWKEIYRHWKKSH